MSYLSLLYSGEDEKTVRNVYSILKHLTLYDFYEELNKELGKEIDKELEKTPDTKSKCNYCQGNIASNAENGAELINLCKIFCNIMFNVHGIFDECNSKTDNKACHYMGYWLYYNVMNLTNDQSLVSNFYIPVLMYTGFNRDKFNNCSIKSFEIDKNKFDIKRTLYEFIEIYDQIKNEISDEINLNVNTYCKHIKENFQFYNNVKVKCHDNTCKYHTELQNFKNKFSEFNELEFICEKCDYEKTSCEKGSNAEDDVPCLREKGISFLYLIFGNDADNIINFLLKVTTISAPILAFFVILFKFTPLGKNLNKIKQERKKSGHKKKEENIQDYMKNYAAHLDSEMKNRIHLGYHAT